MVSTAKNLIAQANKKNLFMNNHVLLVYFFIKYRGDQKAICDALRNKEEVTADEAAELLSVGLKPVPEETQFITICDSEYPKFWIGKMPLVLQFRGKLETVQSPEQTVIVENGALTPYLEKQQVSHITYNEEEQSIVVSGKKGILTLIAPGGYLSIFQLGTVALAIDGTADFAASAEGAKTIMKRMALPGVAGCACNKLIKRGWSLCDCADDLKACLQTETEQIEVEQEDK